MICLVLVLYCSLQASNPEEQETSQTRQNTEHVSHWQAKNEVLKVTCDD